MIRRLVPALVLAIPLVAGCAGPAKLAERSEKKLAEGDLQRAWMLATQALDKAPGNAQARSAAAATAAAIADERKRRIHDLAPLDSLGAAEQVLDFQAFRASAARYTTVPVDDAWVREELALRQSAARTHYALGRADMESRRPKRAYLHFSDAQRFVAGYRDAARLADRAFEKALTRVAIVPLGATSGRPTLGRDVAASWRGDVVERMATPESHFTRILPVEDIERKMSVSDLGRLTRDDAIELGRRAGADRIVWGSIGKVDAKTGVQLFTDAIAHRIVEKGPDGRQLVRWVSVPFQVISRVRTVNADVEYEVIATRGGATLARRHDTRTMNARVVWTSFTPEGSCDSYSLVSETSRASDPEGTRRVEARWSAVVGEGTTLLQVLEAKRSGAHASNGSREAIARLMAGAAFVMLEELPPTEELAFGALAGGWKPLYDDLSRLDGVDDVDLGPTAAEADRR